MAKDDKTEGFDGAEICCFQCAHKLICNVVNPIWHPDFKKNLRKVAQLDRQQKFFEGVERMLARICDHFSPDI